MEFWGRVYAREGSHASLLNAALFLSRVQTVQNARKLIFWWTEGVQAYSKNQQHLDIMTMRMIKQAEVYSEGLIERISPVADKYRSIQVHI